jgi:hypothetical protein
LKKLKVHLLVPKNEEWVAYQRMNTSKKGKRRDASKWKIGSEKKEKHQSSIVSLRLRLQQVDTQSSTISVSLLQMKFMKVKSAFLTK